MADTPQVNEADPGSGGASLAFERFTSPTTADAAWSVIVCPDGSGGGNVVDAANPLPATISGVATEAKQDTLITSNAAIQSAVEGTLTVDGSGVTQPVSAASLPLPAGASTATNQSTLITSNAAIQAALEGTLTITASSLPLPTGAATSANQSTIVTSNAAIQAAVEGTLTVDGSGVTQPVSAASLPLPSGASTAAHQATQNTALTAIQTAVEGTVAVSAASLPLPSGAATETTLDAVKTAVEGTITVSGTVTANLSATDNAVLDAINASNAGMETDIDAINTNISTMTTDLGLIKSDIDNLDGCISGSELQVDIVSAPTLTVDLGANNDIQGDVAHDTADTGNPVKVRAVATDHTAVTGVADGDRTDLRANVDGVLMTMGCSPGLRTICATIAAADGAQTNAALLTTGAGKVVVTRLSIQCSNANSVDVDAKVGFASSTLPTPGTAGSLDVIHEAKAIPAGGGITIGDGSGIIGLSGSDGEDLRYTVTVPAGGHVSISATYYVIDS